MIDANQDKKCERNNQIVENLEKLITSELSSPILDRLIEKLNESKR